MIKLLENKKLCAILYIVIYLEGEQMRTEIECRLLNVDVEKFIRKLKENNATFMGDWIQIRNCYDFNPVKKNSWIRLRTNGIETTLTIKEINNSKIDGTKELEIVVSDFKMTDEILNKLGYIARSKQENRRIRYVLDEVEIDIDFWPQIPAYVEFEAEDEEKIIRLCSKLGINYKEMTSLDVQNIYQKYGITLSNYSKICLEDDVKNETFDL